MPNISYLITILWQPIIDSIISLHRAEFAGRETLAERQQRLNLILHKLIRLAEIYNVAVVYTNQGSSSTRQSFWW